MVRARFCIERGRYWQAEYWISAARDYGLSLACRRRGLSAFYGRGFDELPGDVLARVTGALPTAIERDALLAALKVTIAGVIEQARDLPAAAKVEASLRELMQS